MILRKFVKETHESYEGFGDLIKCYTLMQLFHIFHFRNSYVLLLSLLIQTSFLFAQKTEVDSLITKTINVEEILISTEHSKGLTGVKISLKLDSMIVADDSLRINYRLNDKLYTRKFNKLQPKLIDEIAIFHPFAILFKTSGTHTINFVLDKIIDVAKQTKYQLKGIKKQVNSVQVPTMHQLQVQVNYTKVTPKTPKGKAWDFHLFPRTTADKYPDLIYTIESEHNEASRGIFSGQFFRAHKQKNTLIASWPYFSDAIYYCEGDVISLCIKDADLIFHDKIGCISTDEMISQERSTPLEFGSVLKFDYEMIVK